MKMDSVCEVLVGHVLVFVGENEDISCMCSEEEVCVDWEDQKQQRLVDPSVLCLGALSPE